MFLLKYRFFYVYESIFNFYMWIYSNFNEGLIFLYRHHSLNKCGAKNIKQVLLVFVACLRVNTNAIIMFGPRETMENKIM